MKKNMKKISMWLFAIVAGVSMTAMVSCSKDDDGNTDNTGAGKTDPSTIAADNLIAYFPFEGAENPEIGTGITYASKGANTSFPTGKRGNAFQGKDDETSFLVYSLASSAKLFAAKEYTLAFWMKAPKEGGGQAVFQLNGGDANMGSLAFIKENWTPETSDSLTLKSFFYNLIDPDRIWKSYDLSKANPAFAADKWIHIVALYNATTSIIEMYANGKQALVSEVKYPSEEAKTAGQPTLGQIALDQTSNKLYFGNWGKKITNTSPESWMSAYDGMLDEFRIYNKALTEKEIDDLYKAEVLNMNE
jgi:hypothetical protein